VLRCRAESLPGIAGALRHCHPATAPRLMPVLRRPPATAYAPSAMVVFQVALLRQQAPFESASSPREFRDAA